MVIIVNKYIVNTILKYNISGNNSNYSNGVRTRGDTVSLEIFKTMISLGNLDIEFHTMDSDLTKRLIYGRYTDSDRVVSSAAEFYSHNGTMNI